jgi:hypothetical protein
MYRIVKYLNGIQECGNDYFQNIFYFKKIFFISAH